MYAKPVKAKDEEIRYSDAGGYRWLWTHAPCAWQGNVQLRFSTVNMGSLRPAGCWIDAAAVDTHLLHMREGRAVAPLVVCVDGKGGWYIHDGNHRYLALRNLFSESDDAEVRVAVVIPKIGFRFVYRWFGVYGTYLLEPLPPISHSDPFFCRTIALEG